MALRWRQVTASKVSPTQVLSLSWGLDAWVLRSRDWLVGLICMAYLGSNYRRSCQLSAVLSSLIGFHHSLGLAGVGVGVAEDRWGPATEPSLGLVTKMRPKAQAPACSWS